MELDYVRSVDASEYPNAANKKQRRKADCIIIPDDDGDEFPEDSSLLHPVNKQRKMKNVNQPVIMPSRRKAISIFSELSNCNNADDFLLNHLDFNSEYSKEQKFRRLDELLESHFYFKTIPKCFRSKLYAEISHTWCNDNQILYVPSDMNDVFYIVDSGIFATYVPPAHLDFSKPIQLDFTKQTSTPSHKTLGLMPYSPFALPFSPMAVSPGPVSPSSKHFIFSVSTKNSEFVAGDTIGDASLIQPDSKGFTMISVGKSSIWSIEGTVFRQIHQTTMKEIYEHRSKLLSAVLAGNTVVDLRSCVDEPEFVELIKFQIFSPQNPCYFIIEHGILESGNTSLSPGVLFRFSHNGYPSIPSFDHGSISCLSDASSIILLHDDIEAFIL